MNLVFLSFDFWQLRDLVSILLSGSHFIWALLFSLILLYFSLPLWRREMTHRAEQEIEETRKRPPLDNEEDSSPLECLFARLIAFGLLSLLKVFSFKEEGGEKALSFLSSFFSLTCR